MAELIFDSPNRQANDVELDTAATKSLLTFVPRPLFLLPQQRPLQQRKSKRDFEFSFANPLLLTGTTSMPLIVDRVKTLRRPINTYFTPQHDAIKQQIFAYKRTYHSEVLLSEDIFLRLGLC